MAHHGSARAEESRHQVPPPQRRTKEDGGGRRRRLGSPRAWTGETDPSPSPSPLQGRGIRGCAGREGTAIWRRRESFFPSLLIRLKLQETKKRQKRSTV